MGAGRPSKAKYDRFALSFLVKNSEGRIFNDTWDVTDTSSVLEGVKTGYEEIKLIDYLVYRPLPDKLLRFRNPPNVHQDSFEMQDWYSELVQWCLQGQTVNGEYYNPLFLFWLNVFCFPVIEVDENSNPTGEVLDSNPLYCNIDRYIFDMIWKAIKLKKYIALMGSRGIGKSYIFACVALWYYSLKKKQHVIISSTNEDATNEAWEKIYDTLRSTESRHRGLKHHRLKDSAKEIYSGDLIYTDDGKEERGFLSKIEKIVYGHNAGSTRGMRPNFQHIEEFAAFPSEPSPGSLFKCIAQSKGSWKIMGSILKAFVAFTGTGGSVNNEDAEKIFRNPKGYNILPTYDHGVECGILIPIQFKTGGTWEKTGCPNIRLALEMEKTVRASLEDDPAAYTLHCQEFPFDIKEMFSRRGSNNFNQDYLAHQLTRLKHLDEGIIKPKRGFLHWKRNTENKIVGVYFEENKNGDFIIVEEPVRDDEGRPYKDLYVGGCDSIDQGGQDTSANTRDPSKLALLIKKRIPDGQYFKQLTNIYVCLYIKRSKDVRWDYENVLKASIWYNADINIEYSKINIRSYFIEQKQEKRLMRRPAIAMQTASDKNKGTGHKPNTNLIGTPATEPIIDHQDAKVKAYIDDYSAYMMIQEQVEDLIDYKREFRQKHDITVAMGLCEMADEEKAGIIAKPIDKITKDYKMFGYYRDPVTGVKKYGVIPRKLNEELEHTKKIMQETQPVRWIDIDGTLKFE